VSSLRYQAALGEAIFASDAPDTAFAAFGATPARWQVYRRMVRSRLADNIEHGFARLAAIAGADRFHALVDRFLAVDPPRSHYLRDVPAEFLRFFEANGDELTRSFALPAYARDLARFEWSELETAYSHQETSACEVGPLEMDRLAVLSPALRLIELGYPVHRLGTEAGPALARDAQLDPAPFSLCLYRDAKTHEVAVLELTPVTASMLALMQGSHLTLTAVVRNAAVAVGVTVDVAFVEALSTLLADLVERGVVLGSLVP
jgi:hypothetical protein